MKIYTVLIHTDNSPEHDEIARFLNWIDAMVMLQDIYVLPIDSRGNRIFSVNGCNRSISLKQSVLIQEEEVSDGPLEVYPFIFYEEVEEE